MRPSHVVIAFVIAVGLMTSLPTLLADTPLEKRTVSYTTATGEAVSGYFVYPKAKGTYPGVVMIHEWWGLNGWIRLMADSLAQEGYAVLAVDLYRGKVALSREDAQELMQGTSRERVQGDLSAAIDFLVNQSITKGRKIGTLGWCMGGGYALTLSLQHPSNISAAVMCYGRVTANPVVLAPLRAPLLGIFGARDRGIPVDSVNAMASQLKATNRFVEVALYDSSGHAFMNSTNAQGFNLRDARDAWFKTLAFFRRYLYA